MKNRSYPENWTDIAFSIKEQAGWRCSKCGMQCIRPGEDVSGLGTFNVLWYIILVKKTTDNRGVKRVMRGVKVVSLSAVALMTAVGVSAQEPASALQDLVGAKGGDGEMALRNRGYTWVRTNKSDTESYSYWRENENGQCVGIRTVDGRYASIVYVPQFDCQGGGQSSQAQSRERKDEFETICGVIVNGDNYRYRCQVEDYYNGSQKTRTVLYFPDQTIRLTWKSGNRVGLQFEGMVPKEASYSTSEGETDFYFEDKTYFYISNKDAARREVESFQD